MIIFGSKINKIGWLSYQLGLTLILLHQNAARFRGIGSK